VLVIGGGVEVRGQALPSARRGSGEFASYLDGRGPGGPRGWPAPAGNVP